jgi:hypothetical protein
VNNLKWCDSIFASLDILPDGLRVSLGESIDACPGATPTVCLHRSSNRSKIAALLAQLLAGIAR